MTEIPLPVLMGLTDTEQVAAIEAGREAARRLSESVTIEALTDDEVCGYLLIRQAELAAIVNEMARRRRLRTS